jgi:hypothetical protein
LTESVSTTKNGGTYTNVSGTTSRGGYTSYVSTPSVSVSVPSSTSYRTPSGTETISYVPTSSGYETVVHDTVYTPSGTISYVDTETSGGRTVSSTDSASTVTTRNGGTYTYSHDTLSNGQTESVTA